jgi:cyclic-di-AMP phosphodiesterase PgpH
MNFKKKWLNTSERLKNYKVGDTSLASIIGKAALFLLILFFVPLMFSINQSQRYVDYKIGSIATKKVVAPFNFFILKTEDELKKERQEAVNKIPYYFNYDDEITGEEIDKLDGVFDYLFEKKKYLNSSDSAKLDFNKEIQKIKDEIHANYDVNTTIANLKIVFELLNKKEYVDHLKLILNNTKSYIKQGILDTSLSALDRPNVSVIRDGVEEPLPFEKRLDLANLEEIIENNLLQKFDVNQTFIFKYFFNQILQPNLIFNEELTDQAVQYARNSISLTKDMVYENERIVDANERIDEDIYQKLYSLDVARREQSREEGNWQSRIAFISKMMLLASIILMAGLYLYSFRRKIYNDNKKLFIIVVIILLELVLAAIISGPLNWRAYVIPTTIASMLLAILFDSGIGFIGTVVIALILGGIQGGGYDITLLTIISGMVSIFAVYRIRTRNQVFRAILYIAGAYYFIILALYGLRFDSLFEASKTFVFYMLPNAILSPFITFMVLGVFEKLFDITTDVTLLELSDLNHPLLKRLSLEAPGTFHHSMVVGNLAESAAKVIDGNSLLARVGSYYHDIGKMEKPEYFVENQMDAANRHEALSPNMSALILSSHVKNGVEMAKRYGIPKLIRDFIPEHHGTNTMTYFYKKALENAGDNAVNEADFKYPGPKPQSKETGIVMLADTVEAATRSLANPTPSKIRAFVEELVDKRFEEGQLDECDLTLRDLKNIIDAFMPVLYGVFQHRIEYPDQEKKKPKQANKKS